jgi:hypothetical protein
VTSVAEPVVTSVAEPVVTSVAEPVVTSVAEPVVTSVAAEIIAEIIAARIAANRAKHQADLAKYLSGDVESMTMPIPVNRQKAVLGLTR